VLHQRLEKRRQQAIEVFARSPRHLAGEKRHGVFEQIKNAAQLIELGHGIGGAFSRVTCSPRAKIGRSGARTRARPISSAMFCNKWERALASSAAISMHARP
jgi:hypothetical protein